MQTWKPTILRLSLGHHGLGLYQASEGSLSFRRPIDDRFCTSEEVMGFDGFCHPMSEMDETIPVSSLGRGGGAAGFGGGGFSGRSFEQGFGVMTTQAPFENGLCGPDEVVSVDGTCQPRRTMMMMGQTAPPAAPSRSTPIGVTAAIVGLGAGAAQLLTGDGSMLHKLAFWTEIGALVILASVVVGQAKS